MASPLHLFLQIRVASALELFLCPYTCFAPTTAAQLALYKASCSFVFYLQASSAKFLSEFF